MKKKQEESQSHVLVRTNRTFSLLLAPCQFINGGREGGWMYVRTTKQTGGQKVCLRQEGSGLLHVDTYPPTDILPSSPRSGSSQRHYSAQNSNVHTKQSEIYMKIRQTRARPKKQAQRSTAYKKNTFSATWTPIFQGVSQTAKCTRTRSG